MALGLGWKLHGDGGTPRPGEIVRPDERLSWGRTMGLGAQHVVAMFGATFVFPIIMGLDPNLAILMSGVSTVLFLLIVQGKVPSYLGTSASFFGAVAAIRAGGGDSATVTGAILVAGVVLALSGLLIRLVGAQAINKVLPPVVSGAVVLLIGFNLAPVVASTYWPQDQWTAFITMIGVISMIVLLRGFWARIAIFLGLVFGYALSWAFDELLGPITSVLPGAGAGKAFAHDRIDLSGVGDAAWLGLPRTHAPDFKTSAILLALPAVVALIAENAGHVKAVAEMTRTDLDGSMGRAIFADGLGTAMAGGVGGSPTTTYAENIGVMAATRVYSTAAYYVAAVVAILIGFCPKVGAVIAATPGGVLGGITVVLYGMIGLLGVKIWFEGAVDFGDPVNLIPVAAGVIMGIGGVTLKFSEDFTIQGIALGTIITLVSHHLLRALVHPRRPDAGEEGRARAEAPPSGPVNAPPGPVNAPHPSS
ncbi:uracil-xanthine permease family protein [Actinomadura rubrisoli]|uniref:Nitrate reductase n=1 Tax=Actinomadura rubrisoli TaxID=2530368 RepID=A0A4R5BI99_9ACTN|nr:solute carrier family 23 protein [Actinomadura rubrisoli]TDD84796.1 nitrate reductase [Actinomadura rubrisoli]